MEVKTTAFGQTGLILEFNTCLPDTANTSIAPLSTITATQRYAEVYNNATSGAAAYIQITKLDVIHNLRYTDCKGNVKVLTETTSVMLGTEATSETPTTIVPRINKILDVLIPDGVKIVTQEVISELPTSVPYKSHCAYSVFTIEPPVEAPAPAN
jgi:hypothetical protein